MIIKLKDQKRPLTVEELDDRPSVPKTYRGLWNKWNGREIEFYRHTFHLITELTSEQFENIIGITHRILLEELKSKYRVMMRTQPPKNMIRNPDLKIKKSESGTYFLTGYNPYDQVEVSTRIYEILDYFDGRQPHEEVVAKLLEQGKAVSPQPVLF